MAAVTAVACALPAVALARADDVPAELYAPADGTVVKDASHGLAVNFTCPAYHRGTTDDLITGPVDGYHVILADAADVDANGVLLLANRVDVRDAVRLELPDTADGPAPAHCTAAEDDAGFGLLPREPGTYWWQVYRDCDPWVCAGGMEASDAARVTVTRTVCTVQRAAYAQARAALTAARRQLAHRATTGRRARVARLGDRVTLLRARLRVVYGCKLA